MTNYMLKNNGNGGIAMKRSLLLILVMLLCISAFSGCTRIEDLSSANKIEITKYDTASNSGDVYSITVTDKDQVAHICENLNSLRMKEMGYNKPTAIEYTLKFSRSGKQLQTISITAHGWIDYNGDFYTVESGELDIEYIKSLFSDDTQSNT